MTSGLDSETVDKTCWKHDLSAELVDARRNSLVISLVFRAQIIKSFFKNVAVNSNKLIKKRPKLPLRFNFNQHCGRNEMPKKQSTPKFLTGNRCGHSPTHYRQPDPLPAEDAVRMPKFITQMQDEIRKNGVPGFNLRSELDEAVRAVAIAALDNTDLFTCRFGMATKRGWLAYGWQRIHDRLPWCSENRFWQAVKIFKNAEMIESNQRLNDPRFKSKDPAKPSGYAIADKGFTKAFWIAFRQLPRWKREAEAKAQRTTAKAAANGKTLDDFYKKTWCSTTKTAVKQLAAAGIAKVEQQPGAIAPAPAAAPVGPSANAVKMILMDKLIKLGFKDAYARAQKLFDEFGANSLINTEQFVS